MLVLANGWFHSYRKYFRATLGAGIGGLGSSCMVVISDNGGEEAIVSQMQRKYTSKISDDDDDDYNDTLIVPADYNLAVISRAGPSGI